jgi:hypothetical protein
LQQESITASSKGGPMIGIAVAFLVSAVVLMTLSAIEG